MRQESLQVLDTDIDTPDNAPAEKDEFTCPGCTALSEEVRELRQESAVQANEIEMLTIAVAGSVPAMPPLTQTDVACRNCEVAHLY